MRSHFFRLDSGKSTLWVDSNRTWTVDPARNSGSRYEIQKRNTVRLVLRSRMLPSVGQIGIKLTGQIPSELGLLHELTDRPSLRYVHARRIII